MNTHMRYHTLAREIEIAVNYLEREVLVSLNDKDIEELIDEAVEKLKQALSLANERCVSSGVDG